MRIRFASDTPKRDPRRSSGYWWTTAWERMALPGYRWGDLLVVPPHEPADLTIVVNHPGVDLAWETPMAETALIQLEPAAVRHANGSSWGLWEDPAFLGQMAFALTIESHHMGIDWNIARTYEDLAAETYPPDKRRPCSSCLSWKAHLPGHVWRNKLVYGHLADCRDIDFWGQMVPHGSDASPPVWDWKGPLPTRAKDKALAPYRYHLCAENSQEANYWTEKIVDALLCWCLPLYRGCPNLADFLPAGSWIELPEDHTESAELVREVIASPDAWEARIGAIAEARDRILNHWQVFQTIERATGVFH